MNTDKQEHSQNRLKRQWFFEHMMTNDISPEYIDLITNLIAFIPISSEEGMRSFIEQIIASDDIINMLSPYINQISDFELASRYLETFSNRSRRDPMKLFKSSIYKQYKHV